MRITIDYNILNEDPMYFEEVFNISDNERKNYIWLSIQDLERLQIIIKGILDKYKNNKIRIEEAKGGVSIVR